MLFHFLFPQSWWCFVPFLFLRCFFLFLLGSLAFVFALVFVVTIARNGMGTIHVIYGKGQWVFLHDQCVVPIGGGFSLSGFVIGRRSLVVLVVAAVLSTFWRRLLVVRWIRLGLDGSGKSRRRGRDRGGENHCCRRCCGYPDNSGSSWAFGLSPLPFCCPFCSHSFLWSIDVVICRLLVSYY